MTRSDTAMKRGIDNTPTPEVVARLEHLMGVLDKIRERWGAPIRVNSGYRCETLNKAVGGVWNSQHLTGEAADITAGNLGANASLFDLIKLMQVGGEIEFDQLIDEKNMSWIHLSVRKHGNRKEIKRL